MSTQPKPFISPEQYLEIERAAGFKSEYFEGEMFAMSGGTLDHARLQSKINAIISVQLQGRSCEAAGSDLRLLVTPGGPYFYSDLVVFCGEPKFADSTRDTITDATVIIEVLSKSTEIYDRSFKFQSYRRLPSFQEYLLISQDRISIEHRKRNDEGKWLVNVTTDPNAYIHLHSIECAIRVGDVYDRVKFEE